ncbi:putative fungal specific transcription factor [Cladophialophora carrionii]|uniref:Putative fungal specific transcription factor n=1 Tax=Cladophialophora carrionii TaxID=86049 RepID=A0A1C1CNA8_9EURO|nr:putative fungal specific transcription factor [Cladophialophora carrionii]
MDTGVVTTADNNPLRRSRNQAPPAAPAPSLSVGPSNNNNNNNDNDDSTETTMPYTCQTCGKRKVKCDKAKPVCSSCHKSKLECVYQAPQPRRRKRKLSDIVHQRLDQYERILAQHGLLPQDTATSTPNDEPLQAQEPAPSTGQPASDSGASRMGKLVAGEGKSIYLDSQLWHNLGEGQTRGVADAAAAAAADDDDTEEEEGEAGEAEGEDPSISAVLGDFEFAGDPLTGAFMGSNTSLPQNLTQYHPRHAEAMILWQTHVENVEPICKILHVPTTFQMLDRVSREPETVSRADECLLFAIYHFAVFSLTEDDCARKFGQARNKMLQRFHFATRLALVNAAFLRTTEMSILQALVLFLIPGRFIYDPHTYWILTGVAVRIAQRMGLHRDGEQLGLHPFEVQMRRRLFYQLLPLDGIASKMSGTGIATMTDPWDTQQPSNIHDDQIWLGMTEPPQERKGATDMIFCLTRAFVGKAMARAEQSKHDTQSNDDAETLIAETESQVEEKYIRYCNVVDPLHYLTVCLARSAITAMRLRARLPKDKNQAITDTEARELFQLAQDILQTDLAASANTSLRRYRWHLRSFFIWGSWDSLIFTITSLQKPDLLPPATTDAAWRRVEELYNNHGELLESKQALHIAIRRITLKAWAANPPQNRVPEPAFITELRSLRRMGRKSRPDRQGSHVTPTPGMVDTVDQTPSSDANALLSSLSGVPGLDIMDDFSLDTVDWTFWDQLIQGYQAQGGQ